MVFNDVARFLQWLKFKHQYSLRSAYRVKGVKNMKNKEKRVSKFQYSNLETRANENCEQNVYDRIL